MNQIYFGYPWFVEAKKISKKHTNTYLPQWSYRRQRKTIGFWKGGKSLNNYSLFYRY